MPFSQVKFGDFTEREFTTGDVTLRGQKIEFCQWSVNWDVLNSRSVNRLWMTPSGIFGAASKCQNIVATFDSRSPFWIKNDKYFDASTLLVEGTKNGEREPFERHQSVVANAQ